MNEEALNRKLAEWAGWKIGRPVKSKYLRDIGETYHYYDRPKGPSGRRTDIPNFTQSLDACFKWLVPKIQVDGFMVSLDLLGSIQGKWSCRLHKGFFPNKTFSQEEAETPAPALCKAIEKLIDGGKDGR